VGQGSGRAHRLTCAEWLELQRRVRAGERHEVAETAVGCCAKSVQRLLVKSGGVKLRSTPQSALRLSFPAREETSRSQLASDLCRVIARRLGLAPSIEAADPLTLKSTGDRDSVDNVTRGCKRIAAC
jgi:hypothetical protein